MRLIFAHKFQVTFERLFSVGADGVSTCEKKFEFSNVNLLNVTIKIQGVSKKLFDV